MSALEVAGTGLDPAQDVSFMFGGDMQHQHSLACKCMHHDERNRSLTVPHEQTRQIKTCGENCAFA